MINILKKIKFLKPFSKKKVSEERYESNRWLSENCRDIAGDVLSLGSADDSDGEGNFYRSYFQRASRYYTSDISFSFNTDYVLDVRNMSQIGSGTFDCVFCSGVLEHVDDFHSAILEITRILKDRGVLLLGLPFRQQIHLPPNDYWRFTVYGVKVLLENKYNILDIAEMGGVKGVFPATYWIKAIKKNVG